MSENETAKIRVAMVDDHEIPSISSAKRRTCPVRWR